MLLNLLLAVAHAAPLYPLAAIPLFTGDLGKCGDDLVLSEIPSFFPAAAREYVPLHRARTSLSKRGKGSLAATVTTRATKQFYDDVL